MTKITFDLKKEEKIYFICDTASSNKILSLQMNVYKLQDI